MKIKELSAILGELDPDLDIQVRIVNVGDETVSDEPFSNFQGEYCFLTEEANVTIEYGKLTIIGDWTPEN